MTFIRGCLSLALFSVLASHNANANDDWWFDVEVIAFKRNLALTELEEQFTLAESLLVNQADVDVISNAIYPDISWLKQGLATCGVDSNAPPDFPEEYQIHIPDSDVDFLSLPPLPEPEALDDTAALSSGSFGEAAFSESSFGESENVSDYAATNNAEYDESEVLASTESTAEQNGSIEQISDIDQNRSIKTSSDAFSTEPSQDELLVQQSTDFELTDAQSTNDMGEFVEFAVNENGANDANEASTASEETESELEPEVEETPPPRDETIASYWLSFFGLAFEQVFFEQASSVVSSDEATTNTPTPNEALLEKEALPEDAVSALTTEEAKAGISKNAVEYTNRYTVPAFSYCEQPKPWLNIAYTNNGAVWQKDTVDNSLPIPKQLPIIIEGFDFRRAASPHLLSSDQHALTSISRQIRSSRELERMFHVAWRQPVLFGKDNAFNVHLYGGKNYASEFDIDGFMRPAESEIESELEKHIPADSLNALDKLTQTLHGKSSDNALMSDSDSANQITYSNSVDGYSVDSNEANEGNNTQNNNDAASNYQAAQNEPDFFAKLDSRITNPKAIPFSDINPLEKRSSDEEAINADALGGRVPPIWEIDGSMKVFLKYINRVPYLHIDSELFYRQPVPSEYFTNSTFGDAAISNADNSSQDAPIPTSEAVLAATEASAEDSASTQAVEYKLASIPLAEQRRVISTQLHYFDHPLFGFIVQIRRYHRPADEETSDL
ncbi:hypothetical protein KUL42_25780 [Alteromonas sp. KUL42]|uniref:CsiV family protein n=1 Tax=Alteromonas sp. KUL42 TaxID=2480797 RepID=UPI001035F901|nr:CsiV family protein [Alteromonas sp. KUL42]TAP34412.1 hypothetical protein EYR97_12725 [Alteromonas sp. KUL42]GEA07817.1 hypothetical protein KUL42_25780 [Alteromonas sp. KUL42]